MMNAVDSWFTVDREGFGQLMASRPRVAMLHDLLQNVFDEDATTATVTLEPIEGRRGRARLTVEDDCPDGFTDLRDAYTLYKASKKKGDPLKRGRFNEGEKFVLSLCEEATIATTTGTVVFHPDGTRTITKAKRATGSVFDAVARLTRPEVEEVLTEIKRLLVPAGFTVMINGEALPQRTPIRTIRQVALNTVRVNDEGALVSSTRQTSVEIVGREAGEKPHIYEMGIPVVEVDVPWHLNIGQKVPLNRDRDNVTPAYRRALLAAVLDQTVDMLTNDQATDGWVTDALPAAEEATVVEATTKRFGKGWVIGTPNDREADKNAVDHGRAVVGGGALPKEAWGAVRRAGAAQASAVEYTMKPAIGDRPPNMATPSPFVTALTRYTKKVAMFLLDEDYFEIDVWNERSSSTAGRYCGRRIVVNIAHLPNPKDTEAFALAIDDLMIHECAHKFSSDHFSPVYYNACTRLGAKLRTLPTRWRYQV